MPIVVVSGILLGIEFGTRIVICDAILESIGFGCFIDVLGWVSRGVIRSRGVISMSFNSDGVHERFGVG